MPESRPLRVFLCHASQDKPKVRELYQRLKSEKWIDPWLDEEELLPGMDWDLEIYKALREADVIIVCLSNESIAKEGYVQKEFKRALNFAEEKPEGTIYIIPLRFDKCKPPMKFQQWQWLDYFLDGSYDKLLKSLRARATALKLSFPTDDPIKEYKPESPREYVPPNFSDIDLDLYRFIHIPATAEVPYPFWIGKYPVTNEQYERFLNSPDFATEAYWRGFLKFNEDCIQIGRWGNEGWNWLEEKLKESSKPPEPAYLHYGVLGMANSENPIAGITWYEANAYCNWLARHWNELAECHANSILRPRLIRLPLDTEWTVATGGEAPEDRYPWDEPGKSTTDQKEIVRRANVIESNIRHTTPVNGYFRGASLYGVMDMAGNVWEWQANFYDNDHDRLTLRGGSWSSDEDYARLSFRDDGHPYYEYDDIGFRVVLLPREASSSRAAPDFFLITVSLITVHCLLLTSFRSFYFPSLL